MALGGGSLPAVPETATVYTLSDVLISVGEDSVFLNPKLVLTVAPGAEKLQAKLEVQSGEDVFLPMAGEINADGLAFKLGEGNAYSLSAEALDELSGGVEIPAEAMEMVGSVKDMVTLIPEISKRENQAVANRLLIDSWYAADGVTPEKVDVLVGDKTIKGEKAELSLSIADVYSSLDAIIANGNAEQKAYGEALLKYCKNMMKLAGVEMEIASFKDMVDLLAAENTEILSAEMPLTLTTAIEGDMVYMEGDINAEVNGMKCVSYMNGKQDSEGFNELVEFNGSMEEDGDNTNIGVMVSASGDANGSLSMIAEVSAINSYSYDETTDAGESYSWGGGSDMNLSVILSQRVSNSDMVNTSFTADLLVRDSYFDESDADFNYEYNTSFNLNGQIVDSVAEDRSINRAFYVSVVGSESDASGAPLDGSEVNFTLSYVLNKKEVPFADAFADAQFTALPGQSEDAEGNLSPEYQQLMFEVMGLMGDVMTLSSEESVMELMELVNKYTATGEVEAVEGVSIDEGYTYEEDYEYPEYIYDANQEGAVLDLAAAAEVYGAEIPEFTAPEGYELAYLYASEGYVSYDYSAADTYFSLVISPSYSDSSYQTMTLNPDGTLTANEGTQVQLMVNDDGTVVYAEIFNLENNVTIYFDNAAMETVQAVLAGI